MFQRWNNTPVLESGLWNIENAQGFLAHISLPFFFFFFQALLSLMPREFFKSAWDLKSSTPQQRPRWQVWMFYCILSNTKKKWQWPVISPTLTQNWTLSSIATPNIPKPGVDAIVKYLILQFPQTTVETKETLCLLLHICDQCLIFHSTTQCQGTRNTEFSMNDPNFLTAFLPGPELSAPHHIAI